MSTQISIRYKTNDRTSVQVLDADVVDAQVNFLVAKGTQFNAVSVKYECIEKLMIDGNEVTNISQEGVAAELGLGADEGSSAGSSSSV